MTDLEYFNTANSIIISLILPLRAHPYCFVISVGAFPSIKIDLVKKQSVMTNRNVRMCSNAISLV